MSIHDYRISGLVERKSFRYAGSKCDCSSYTASGNSGEVVFECEGIAA
jgi:hypothetical protein